MSQCCEGNNEEILNILMGYAYSENNLKKSLWWITRDFLKKDSKVFIIDDGNCGNVRRELENHASRIDYQIIKIDNRLLVKNFKINNLDKSPKLAYAICNKFCSGKKIQINSKNICFNKSFKEFAENIDKYKTIEMRTYLVPKYIQSAITDYSSNFCNLLAFECRKYPLYAEDFPAKNENFIVKGYCDSIDDKEKIFLDFESFHFETDQEDTESLENIDLSLIDKVIEYID